MQAVPFNLAPAAPLARQISTTAPLTGGGDLSADRTIGLPLATPTSDGGMPAADKAKLDGISPGGTPVTVLATSGHDGLQSAANFAKQGRVADVMDPAYGTVGDGATDDTAHFSSAHTAVGANGEVVIPPATYSLATNATLASAQRFVPGAVLKIATNKTITLTGAVNDTWRKIFDTSASGAVVSFAGNTSLPHVRPEWWGAVAGTDSAPIAAANDAAISAALTAAIGIGVPVVFRAGQTYYLSAEIGGSAGFCLASSVPLWGVTLKISSTANPRTVSDLVTNGTTTVTSATANFTAADVGRAITSIGGGVPNNTIINSVTNGTTAVMNKAATASASGMQAKIQIRSCCRFGHVSASTVGDACTTSAVGFDANFRAKYGFVLNGASFCTFDVTGASHANSHGIKLMATPGDGGGGTINDNNEFRRIFVNNNGTSYASPGIASLYSSNRVFSVVTLTGASVDMASGSAVLTLNGVDINTLDYLEPYSVIRVGPTGSNMRVFVISSWTRISSTQATITCFVPDATNSSDNQPYTDTALDFCIGCGDNYHEDAHNDNNLNTIRGGISRAPAGFNAAFDGLYGPNVETLQCDIVMNWAYRLGHAGSVLYIARFTQGYVEGSGAVTQRRAFAMFNCQQVFIDSLIDGVSSAGVGAGQGHIDYMPNGNSVSGILNDTAGTWGLGSNGWQSQTYANAATNTFTFKGGLLVSSLASAQAGDVTLNAAHGGQLLYWDVTAASHTATLSTTLPVGWECEFAKYDGSGNTVTISGTSCTISGASSYVLSTAGQAVRLRKGVGGIFFVTGKNP